MIKTLIGAMIGAHIGYFMCCLMVTAKEDRMKKQLRTRKMKKEDEKRKYEALVRGKVDESAAEQMHHKPYESYSVPEYLKKKMNMK